MGQFTDIKALAGKVLKFGKVGATIDAQAPTANRTVYLPDANIDLRAGVDGQALTQTSATTVGWSDVNAKRMLTRVFNDLGSTVAKAKVVYLNGVQGDRPKIALAQADNETNSTRTYGLTYASILNMEDGQVISEGLIDGLNTNIVGWNEGDSLWLSPTSPGDYTNVKPAAPNHAVFIGTLVRKHITQGSIQVKIQNGYELEELHNVSIPTTPTDGQVLTWETATSLWKAKTVGGGGGGGGYTEIAAGGTISGTYSGIVFCLGNVSVSGNVTVKGSLYIIGNITNTGGYAITVNGDCIIDGYLDFLAASSTTQQNITVDGDFIIRGERLGTLNQAVVGSGQNEKMVSDSGQRTNAYGGILVNVTEITPGVEFDLIDATGGSFFDLSTAAGVGNYLGDTAFVNDSEILTMVDQGGGTWRVTVDTPISLGSTARLGTRNIYETSDMLLTNSTFWSLGFGSYGDSIEFPTLATTGLFSNQTLGFFGSAWIKLQSNVTGIINEFSHYFARNQVITVSGNPSWFSFSTLYVVSGTGPLGEGQTINNSYSFNITDLTVRLSSPYSSNIASASTILATDATAYIIMASPDLDGETVTFGAGSVNDGDTVTLSLPAFYSGSFFSGYRYQVFPPTTLGIAAGDTIDIPTNEGSRISPNGPTTNGVILVGGDFISKGLDLTPQASDLGGPMSVTVNGDLIGLKILTKEPGETKLVLNALSQVSTFRADAGNLNVGGDVIGMTIEAKGAESTAAAYEGGNGGDIIIGGDFDGFTYYDDGSTGNSLFYASNTAGYYLGNYITNKGGDNSGPGTTGVGGMAGKLKISGDCRLKTLVVRGGDYIAGFPSEGDGGDVDEIYIGGNFFCSLSGSIRPGYTKGTNGNRPLAGTYLKSPYFGGNFAITNFMIGNSPGSGAVSGPAYASVLIEGSLLSVYAPSNLYLYANDVNQQYSANTQARPCSLNVRGDSNITNIRAGTGNFYSENYGDYFNGGNIVISGDNRSNIYASGSPGSTGLGSGSGGSVTISGDCYGDIYAAGYGSKQGGTIDIRGDYYGGNLSVDGGAGSTTAGLSTNGATAGSITIAGNLYGGLSTQLYARGGASASNAGNGNQGGSVTIRGSVTGPTNIQMSVWGGNASGTTGNGNGGNGGSVQVTGSVTGWVFVISGGSARAGGTGGDAGSLTIGGFYSNGSTNTAITAAGGSANSPGTNGLGGGIVLRGGCAIHGLQSIDGQGTGSAPALGYGLRLAGNNTLFSIQMTSRSGVTIFPINLASGNMTNTMVLVTQMVGKNNFNNPAGGTTGAHTPGNLYYATNNQWYRVAGVVA